MVDRNLRSAVHVDRKGRRSCSPSVQPIPSECTITATSSILLVLLVLFEHDFRTLRGESPSKIDEPVAMPALETRPFPIYSATDSSWSTPKAGLSSQSFYNHGRPLENKAGFVVSIPKKHTAAGQST